MAQYQLFLRTLFICVCNSVMCVIREREGEEGGSGCENVCLLNRGRRCSVLLAVPDCMSHTLSLSLEKMFIVWARKNFRVLSICIFFCSDFLTLPISSAASILVECLRGVDVVTGVFISPAVKHLFELYC